MGQISNMRGRMKAMQSQNEKLQVRRIKYGKG